MRKLKNLLCVVCGVLMLCCAVLPVSSITKEAANYGDFSASAFQMTDLLTNKTVSFRGDSGRPAVLIFGGVGTCGNTNAVMAELTELIPLISSEVPQIFILDIKDNTDAFIRDWTLELGMPDGVYVGSENSVTGDFLCWDMLYKVQPDADMFTMPLVCILDADGILRYGHTGYLESDGLLDALSIVCDIKKETGEETVVGIPIEVVYHQSEARKELARINALRTGDGAWYWNETNDQKIVLTGLSPLTYDYALEKIAMRRAAELVLFYAHTRPNGQSFYTAHSESYPGEESPYDFFTVGENIAYGFMSAEDVQTAWEEENDPYEYQGHRRNMLGKDYSAVGCACVEYGGVLFWVQEFSSDNNRPEPLPANDKATVVTVEADAKAIDDWKIINPPTLTVRVGESVRLSDSVQVVVIYQGASIVTAVTPQWKSDHPNVAAVKNGVLTGVSGGSGRITGFIEMLDWTFSVGYQITSDGSAPGDPSDPKPGDGTVKGDVDLDGKVTASDARLALRRAVNLDDGLTAGQIALADVDLDGAVTAADARVILRVAVGLEVFS